MSHTAKLQKSLESAFFLFIRKKNRIEEVWQHSYSAQQHQDKMHYTKRKARTNLKISSRVIKENLIPGNRPKDYSSTLEQEGLKNKFAERRSHISKRNKIKLNFLERLKDLEFSRKYVDKPISLWKKVLWSKKIRNLWNQATAKSMGPTRWGASGAVL